MKIKTLFQKDFWKWSVLHLQHFKLSKKWLLFTALKKFLQFLETSVFLIFFYSFFGKQVFFSCEISMFVVTFFQVLW